MRDRIQKISFNANTHLLFALIATVFGLFFIFSTPIMWGADETTHVGRVYQLSRGEVFSEVVSDGYSKFGYGGKIPENLKNAIDYVNYDINVNSYQAVSGVKWVDDPAGYAKLTDLKLVGDFVEYNFSNTAIYSPVSYLPSVIGFWLADTFDSNIATTVHLGRLLSLIFYVGLLTSTLYFLRDYKSKWIIFVAGLIPGALYQASVISADTMTIALIYAMIAIILKSYVAGKLTKLEMIILAICTVLIPITKPTYILVSFLSLLVPARHLPQSPYRKVILPSSIVAGVVLYGIWQYKTGYLTNAAKYTIAGVVPWWENIDAKAQMHYVLTHPAEFFKSFLRTIITRDDSYFVGLFGRLGFNYVQVPATAIVTSLTAMTLAVVGNETIKTNISQKILLLGVILGSIGAIFGALYLTISDIGQPVIEGVQGRYFIPLLPLALLMFITSTRQRLDASNEGSSRRLSLTIVGLVIFSLFITSLKFFYVTWG